MSILNQGILLSRKPPETRGTALDEKKPNTNIMAYGVWRGEMCQPKEKTGCVRSKEADKLWTYSGEATEKGGASYSNKQQKLKGGVILSGSVFF